MFGQTLFILRTILIWGLLTVVLVESARQKKDVHHMIFVNESRRPSKSHRHKDYQHHDFYKEKRPSKPRKKPGKKENILEDSGEESNHEEFSRHQYKYKRHQHKNTHNHQPSRNQKRHNNREHQNNHKKHHKKEHPNHNHHGHYKSTQSKFTPNSPDNWIPMSSKEFFGGEHQNHRYFRGNGFGHQAEGFIQPIPLEITTPLPTESINEYHLQSTIYPPLSLKNQKVKNGPQPPLIGTVQPYKPFDYSVLEQKPQHFEFQEPEVSASNVVNVKHKFANSGSPLSIVVDNSRETVESNKQEENEEQKSEEAGKNLRKVRKNGKGRGEILDIE